MYVVLVENYVLTCGSFLWGNRQADVPVLEFTVTNNDVIAVIPDMNTCLAVI